MLQELLWKLYLARPGQRRVPQLAWQRPGQHPRHGLHTGQVSPAGASKQTEVETDTVLLFSM